MPHLYTELKLVSGLHLQSNCRKILRVPQQVPRLQMEHHLLSQPQPHLHVKQLPSNNKRNTRLLHQKMELHLQTK